MDLSDAPFFVHSSARVAAPETIAEAQEIVARSQGQAIVPWGGGTQQHVGYPPERCDLILSTQNLTHILEYEPADLTVTAQSGVTISQLQAALAARGQWLPLEVAFPERQTLGGLVAARPHSLGRFRYGSVRDQLIGVKVINQKGEWVVGGGKVVKNVAGYDLPKLYCGSWGTLGWIGEASFRVAPLPERRMMALVPLPVGRNAEEALDHVMVSELEPAFLFLLNPAAAQKLSTEAEELQYLVIGLDGSEEDVSWQSEALGAPLLEAQEADIVRAGIRDFPLMDAPMSATFHVLSSQVGAFARMIEWTAQRAGFSAQVAADAAVGIIHAHFFPAAEKADWERFYRDLADKALRVGGSWVVTRVPDSLRACDISIWSPLLPDFELMRRLKQTLDPQRMWNPGRFIGRI